MTPSGLPLGVCLGVIFFHPRPALAPAPVLNLFALFQGSHLLSSKRFELPSLIEPSQLRDSEAAHFNIIAHLIIK